MAGKRKRDNGWEYVFKRAGVLDKPLYMTFADEAEGDAYAKRLDALLARGIVPTEHRPGSKILTIAHLVAAYLRDAQPSAKDVGALASVEKIKGTTMLAEINAAWVDAWISEMKQVDKLAPSTIRSKVGALARCTDWGMRKRHLELPDHALRSLPVGYAQYTELDTAIAGVEKTDVERDRRIEPGEWERIMGVIHAGVLPRKQRPLVLEHQAALQSMVVIATESAMRMRELYTLTLDQVRLDVCTVFLEKTKNGDKRQVPLSSVALAELKEYLKVRTIPEGHRQDALFPWWSGVQHGAKNAKELVRLSDYLSKLFISIFEVAKCDDLKFHDLRHEATSRLFEKTTLSEMQIMKITGHKSHRMMMRYANLRGSDLASRLW